MKGMSRSRKAHRRRVIKEILCNAGFVLMIFGTILVMLVLSGFRSYANEYVQILETATEEDKDMLARVVYHEAGHGLTNYNCQIAVAETVLNRCLDKDYPDTITEVILQSGQFAVAPYIKKGTPDRMATDAALYALEHGCTVLPDTDYIYFATLKQSYATDHVWIGQTRQGKPRKNHGHYYGRAK